MKRFSLFKILTLVGFFVFSVNVWAADACPTMAGVTKYTNCETKFPNQAAKIEQCSTRVQCLQEQADAGQAAAASSPNKSNVDEDTDCNSLYKSNPSYLEICNSLVKAAVTKKAKDDQKEKDNQLRQDKKEAQAECKSAYSDWAKEATTATSACRALSSTGTSCMAKLKSCRSQISGALSPFGETDEDGENSSTNAFLGLLQTSIAMKDAQQQQSNSSASSTTAVDSDAAAEAAKLARTPQCIKAFNAKAKKEAEKEYQTEKQKLEKEIEEEKSKINKANEKLREKSTQITGKINEAQKKLDEELLSITSDIEAQKNKQQQEALKDMASTNAINMEILTIQDQINNAKFKHSQSMIQFAADKVELQCKSALDTAKNCMSRSAKGEKFSAQDTCAPFAFSGKGTKAIGDLKEKISQIRKACFEQATMGAQSAEQGQKMTMNALERQLQTKRNELDMNAKKLAQSQQAAEGLTTQSTNKQNTAKTNTEKEIANLRQETLDLTQSTKDHVDTANARIAKIQKDVENLTVKKKFDVEPVIEEAEDAIETAENKRVVAEAACCSGASEKEFSNECNKVISAPTNPNPAKSKEAAKNRAAKARTSTGK